jgi:predicted nucleic acid-binding protein
VNEKPSSIERLLSGHRRVALDSNVLIYLVEGAASRGEVAGRLVSRLIDQGIEMVLATIGLSEILMGPARAGDPDGFESLAAELRGMGLRLVALDASIAEDAAWLRGRARLDLVDAIHVASARAAGATLFLTNDRGIPSVPQLEVVSLDDLVACRRAVDPARGCRDPGPAPARKAPL